MFKVYMPRKVIAVGNSLAITIPTDICKKHNITKGDGVAFITEDGRVISIDMEYEKNSEEQPTKRTYDVEER